MRGDPKDQEMIDAVMRDIEYTLGENGFGAASNVQEWHRHDNALRITVEGGRIFVLSIRPM